MGKEKQPSRIGQIVLLLRVRRGISRAELAASMGCHESVIWRMECGGEVRSSTIAKLCATLGVSADYLLGLEQ